MNAIVNKDFTALLNDIKKLSEFNKLKSELEAAQAKAGQSKDLAQSIYIMAEPMAKVLLLFSDDERQRFTKSLHYLADYCDKVADKEKEAAKAQAAEKDKEAVLLREASAYANAYSKKFFEDTGARLSLTQWYQIRDHKRDSLRSQQENRQKVEAQTGTAGTTTRIN